MPDDSRPPGARPRLESWLTPETAAGIVATIAFWAALVAWPNDWDVGDAGGWRWWVGGGALVLFGVVVVGVFFAQERLKYFTPIATVGFIGLAIITAGSGDLGLDDGAKFAVAVGGTALAGLLLGMMRYGTIRAAASTAAVILVIGVLTFPGGREAVGEDNVATIVGWMALLIGANGAAEAVLQVKGDSKGDLD